MRIPARHHPEFEPEQPYGYTALLRKVIVDLPAAPGVYIFHSEEGRLPLYIGKNVKLPSRQLCSLGVQDGQPGVGYSKAINFATEPFLYGLFGSRRSALEALHNLADQHRLCYGALGREKLAPGRACFRVTGHAASVKSRPGGANRTFFITLLRMARTGAPWRDLPERLATWSVVYQRYAYWCGKGHFERLFQGAQQPDLEAMMVDSTC